MATGIIWLSLWKGLSKEESLQPGFELRQSGEIPQTGRQWSWSDETEQVLTKGFQIIFWNFQKLLTWGLEGAQCLKCAEQSWKARGECATEMTELKSFHWQYLNRFVLSPKVSL